MLATGVRSSEVIASVLEDYVFANRPPILKVKRSYWDRNLTKNSKDRETTWRQPYKGLPKELAAYVNESRPQTWRQEMFLSGSAPDTPLSADAIKQIFQRISRRLGYNVHAHQTRHTWAQRLSDNGVSPYELMVPGGWSSLGQVDVYYTANKDAAIKAVADAVITCIPSRRDCDRDAPKCCEDGEGVGALGPVPSQRAIDRPCTHPGKLSQL